MHVDALTLAAVADEFERELVGARIEDVIQPTPHAVALQCWGGGRNRWLLASAHPQLARVHFVEGKPRKLIAEPPAFVMLLRKHLEGARVVAIRQPRWERLLEIGFAHGPAAAPGTAAVWLIIEVMGRISNLVLRDDSGTVLGALRNVGSDVNRYRTIAPNVPYRYPPPQTRTLRGESAPRLTGENVTADALREAAEAQVAVDPAGLGRAKRGPTVADLLAAHVLGFSRDLGSEVTARALGDTSVPLARDLPWEAVATETRGLAALMETRAWQPTLVYAGVESATPSDCAVYAPQRFGNATLRTVAHVSAMLATYFEGAEWRGAVESAKSDLRHLLQTLHERSMRKEAALRDELAALSDAQRLREEADILLAFQSEVSRGQVSYAMENPFAEADGRQITIALDPRLSAVENANKRYDRYHKLQRAAELIPPQLEANALERARIEQLQTDLALAETPAETTLVRAEVAEAGYLRGKAAQTAKQGKAAKASKNAKYGKGAKGAKGGQASRRPAEGGAPLRRQSSDGFTLLIGKNSRQNEEVTFHEASGNDLWLHARGVPGAHVIVKAGGRPVPDTTLNEAAAAAAYYSQAREAGSVPVDYTQQRYVRHMKGGGPGMVIYEHERTLHVAPADAATS